MDQLGRLRELVELLMRKVQRDMPRFWPGEVSVVHTGPPLTVDIYINNSPDLDLAVPVHMHVTGLANGSIVSVRQIGSDLVVVGRVS